MDLFEKTPWYFWLVAILSLVWFAGGAYDYIMTSTQNEAYFAMLSDAQRQWLDGRPLWFTVAWAISIWSSVLGAILLLLRRRVAGTLFLVGLIGYLVACVYSYILSTPNAIEISGTVGLIMGIMIGFSLLLLMLFSANMARRGVLK